MAGCVVLPSLSGVPRLADASRRLAELVLQRLDAPFAWGRCDCVLWAADAIAAQLGVDPAAQFRGRYATHIGAHRLLTRLGGLRGLATGVLGQPLASPLMARHGDVGLLQGGALGVCGGETWLVVTGRGLGHVAQDQARQAWRVGHA